MSDATLMPVPVGAGAGNAVSDLQVLIGQGVKIKDKTGKEHILKPLDLNDLAAMEERLGSLDRFGVNMSFRDALFVIWLSLRKENKTDKDIELGRFSCTEVESRQMFSLGQIEIIKDVIRGLMATSGLAPAGGKPDPHPGAGEGQAAFPSVASPAANASL